MARILADQDPDYIQRAIIKESWMTVGILRTPLRDVVR